MEAVIDKAGPADIPFLVEAVLAAERNGGAFTGMARVFGLREEDLPERIDALFREEVDGCEFSVGSFRIARSNGTPMAAVAGWIEGVEEDGMPSAMLRSNLIGFTFPPASMDALRANAEALADMRIERLPGVLQIEYVYVAEAFRGEGHAARLIRHHMQEALSAPKPPTLAQLQVYADNAAAIRLYESLGFRTERIHRSTDPRIHALLPHPEKRMMTTSL